MKTTTLQLRNVNRSRVGLAFLLISLACFGLSSAANATCQDACLTNNNTVQGDDALISLTTGVQNTAIGAHALFSNTTGFDNTANGYEALFSSTTGGGNTANGIAALFSNTTGSNNTAVGFAALLNNTANENVACGASALSNNTSGGTNTAVGTNALFANTTASFNTALGSNALYSNTGSDNVAVGAYTLYSNTSGAFNTAVGNGVLNVNASGANNTACGYHALQNNDGSNNIAVGFNAGINLTFGINNIDIGSLGVAGESKKIRIGKVGTQNGTYIAGISGTTVATGVAVIVDSSGHLGTTTSSARYKEAIKPMDKASEAILALKPVTFRYKKELDPEGIRQFGLVAEDVEKINPDLVARDKDGKPYSVRYDAVNAMLLNEFLKAYRRVEEQDKRIDQLTAQLKRQAAQIEKVSAQLELRKPAPQTVLNNQ